MKDRTYELVAARFDALDLKKTRAHIRAIDTYLRNNPDLPLEDKVEVLSARAGTLRTMAEVQRQETVSDAEETLLSILELISNDIHTLLSLGSLHLYQSRKLKEALEWTEKGVNEALTKRQFVSPSLRSALPSWLRAGGLFPGDSVPLPTHTVRPWSKPNRHSP